ncbi:MAG: radical SAM protein [Nitrospirae bacterium]|nr:radical SAM protein [Nitrospirota bacterium]
MLNNSEYIHLDNKGNLYKALNGELTRYVPGGRNGLDALLESFRSNPSQIFFKTPFSFISYAVDDKIINSFRAHPSSFYPGTPFDVFDAVESYLKDRKLVIPRFYLYPSSVCNSRCTICQFNFRRKSLSYIKFEIIKKILNFMAGQKPRPKLLSSIISGDGEPTLHPEFSKILDYSAGLNINTFLTSNWILPHDKGNKIMETVARNISMLTISIKGLDSHAYHLYQGMDEARNIFNRVIENLETLLENLERFKRRDQILIGIASLILPENTPFYGKLIKYFVSLKLDYIYLNVAEPSYEKWGIHFTDTEKRETLDSLSSLREDYESCGTLIRFPANPFKTRYNQSVYYDADNRKVKHICGSALWNPTAISINNNNGILLSCRSSENFNDKNFWYSSDIDSDDLCNVMDSPKISMVMESTKNCHQCRLERVVTLFDKILDTEIENDLKGTFLLTFDVNKITRQNGAITFEETL